MFWKNEFIHGFFCSQQYKEAIDETRKGRPYDYNELAELPGFAPIPFQQPKAQPSEPAAAPVKTSQSTAQVRPTSIPAQRPIPTAESLPQLPNKSATSSLSILFFPSK